jgi:hypothetical protein
LRSPDEHGDYPNLLAQAIRPEQAAYAAIRMRVLSEPRKVTFSGKRIQLCPTLANGKREPVAGGCVFTRVVRPTEPQADTSPGPSV